MVDLYSSYPDERLFSLLKNDDEGAFTELYYRYGEKLLVRANLLLHSQEDAEEVVHDVFVNLWKKRADIHIIHAFHTYIAAMLRYGCFKVLAKRKQLRKNISIEVDSPVETSDCSTQQWLAFENLRQELEAAVSRLPEKCQLIFRLSREQYMSDKEIAQELDLSVHTVRTQMYRALQKLKTSLGSFFCL